MCVCVFLYTADALNGHLISKPYELIWGLHMKSITIDLQLKRDTIQTTKGWRSCSRFYPGLSLMLFTLRTSDNYMIVNESEPYVWLQPKWTKPSYLDHPCGSWLCKWALVPLLLGFCLCRTDSSVFTCSAVGRERCECQHFTSMPGKPLRNSDWTPGKFQHCFLIHTHSYSHPHYLPEFVHSWPRFL